MRIEREMGLVDHFTACLVSSSEYLEEQATVCGKEWSKDEGFNSHQFDEDVE